MNVLITAGGTVEKIDNVRSISNMSTGKLGSLIADRFGAESTIDQIFYICSRAALKPQTDKAEIIYVDSVFSLENAVKETLSRTTIDIVIHSMAVSDYRVKSVTSSALIADAILSNLDEINDANAHAAKEKVISLLNTAESLSGADGKISSAVDDMLIFMERTPKIISLFQDLAPEAQLVGFKLLHDVPLETLINTGFQILTKNKCSFVLANDLKDISEEEHIGYLIDKEKNYTRHVSKEDIADAIVAATIQ